METLLTKRALLHEKLGVPKSEIDKVFNQFRVPRIGQMYHVESVRVLLCRVGKKQCLNCGQWKDKKTFWKPPRGFNDICADCRTPILNRIIDESEARHVTYKMRERNKRKVLRVARESAPSFFALASIAESVMRHEH